MKLTFLVIIIFLTGCSMDDSLKFNFSNNKDQVKTSSCKIGSDCPQLTKDCGDFQCVAQETTCLNGICCGGYYAFDEEFNELEKEKYRNDYKEWHKVDWQQYNFNIKDKKDFPVIECAINTAQKSTEKDCDYFEGDFRRLCRNLIFSRLGSSKDDYDYCELIQDDLIVKDNCYSMVAIGKDEPEFCEFINNVEVKEDCLSHIYFLEAQDKKDIDLCFKVPNLDKREVGKVEYSREKCFYKLAEKVKDISICDNIIRESYKERCRNNNL